MSEIDKFTPLWGNWNIENLIGEGSFGKVYKAVRKEFNIEYYSAIKHIEIPQDKKHIETLYSEGLITDEISAREYFEQIAEDLLKEIQLMYQLRGNTNIVAYEDHTVIPKTDMPGYDIFIRMELLKSMDSYIRERDLTESEIVKMGIDICTALDIMARENLIHRDIKPANIFISKNGDYKLGDFGVARQMERTSTLMSKKGTYTYMAPELYKGETANKTVDMYSLGLVMYRLLNGNRAPFLPVSAERISYIDNENALMRRIQGNPLPKPAFASDGLAEIILKASAYNPQERYQSPAEMRAELQRYAGGEVSRTVPIIASVNERTPVRPVINTDEKTEGIFGQTLIEDVTVKKSIPVHIEIEKEESIPIPIYEDLKIYDKKYTTKVFWLNIHRILTVLGILYIPFAIFVDGWQYTYIGTYIVLPILFAYHYCILLAHNISKFRKFKKIKSLTFMIINISGLCGTIIFILLVSLRLFPFNLYILLLVIITILSILLIEKLFDYKKYNNFIIIITSIYILTSFNFIVFFVLEHIFYIDTIRMILLYLLISAGIFIICTHIIIITDTILYQKSLKNNKSEIILKRKTKIKIICTNVILIVISFLFITVPKYEFAIIDKDNIEITDYNVYSQIYGKDIKIPHTILGKQVTTIGRGAFHNGYSLTSIVIPNSVTEIYTGAFKYCDKLMIYTTRNSAAHKYAVENHIRFHIVSN